MVRENIRAEQENIIKSQNKQLKKNFSIAFSKEVERYIEDSKDRLIRKREKGQREILAESYQRLKSEFPEVVNELYPNPMYGIKKGSKAEQLSFPQSFKLDFYEKFRKIKK